jgi:hypothetical protein
VAVYVGTVLVVVVDVGRRRRRGVGVLLDTSWLIPGLRKEDQQPGGRSSRDEDLAIVCCCCLSGKENRRDVDAIDLCSAGIVACGRGHARFMFPFWPGEIIVWR